MTSEKPDITRRLRMAFAGRDSGAVVMFAEDCREAFEEIEALREHIRVLVDEDPNQDAADAVTVLDVWRRTAAERFGVQPTHESEPGLDFTLDGAF